MNNQEPRQDTKPKEETVYKFSNKGQGQLREAAIVEGKSCFLRYHCDQEKNKYFVQWQPNITDVTPNLRPPSSQEYPNNNPYEFRTVEEPQRYLLKALNETPDTLLTKIKSVVKKYNDIDERTATLLSADILG